MSLAKVAVNLIDYECAGELILVEKDMWSADISLKFRHECIIGTMALHAYHAASFTFIIFRYVGICFSDGSLHEKLARLHHRHDGLVGLPCFCWGQDESLIVFLFQNRS